MNQDKKTNKVKHRFFIEHLCGAKEKKIYLTEKGKIHKISKVLRLNIGDEIKVFNGDGYEYQMQILDMSAKNITLKQIDSFKNENKNQFQINLATCLIKSESMKWLLQKAVELGADEIIPVVSERVVAIERNSQQFDKKFKRFKQIIIQAAEQSGRTTLPKLHPITLYESFINQNKEHPNKIILSTHSHKTNFVDYKSKNLLILVGPEGDFSDIEYQKALENGFVELSLGKRVLRAETATISILSIFNFFNL